MDDRRTTLLDELRTRLESLLSGLESDVGPEALAGLRAGCNAAFGRFRDEQELHAGEELPDAVRRGIEAALRLQGVVASLAVRVREDLTVEADKLANARTRLQSLAAKAHVGKSCDLTG